MKVEILAASQGSRRRVLQVAVQHANARRSRVRTETSASLPASPTAT